MQKYFLNVAIHSNSQFLPKLTIFIWAFSLALGKCDLGLEKKTRFCNRECYHLPVPCIYGGKMVQWFRIQIWISVSANSVSNYAKFTDKVQQLYLNNRKSTFFFIFLFMTLRTAGKIWKVAKLMQWFYTSWDKRYNKFSLLILPTVMSFNVKYSRCEHFTNIVGGFIYKLNYWLAGKRFFSQQNKQTRRLSTNRWMWNNILSKQSCFLNEFPWNVSCNHQQLKLPHISPSHQGFQRCSLKPAIYTCTYQDNSETQCSQTKRALHPYILGYIPGPGFSLSDFLNMGHVTLFFC